MPLTDEFIVQIALRITHAVRTASMNINVFPLGLSRDLVVNKGCDETLAKNAVFACKADPRLGHEIRGVEAHPLFRSRLPDLYEALISQAKDRHAAGAARDAAVFGYSLFAAGCALMDGGKKPTTMNSKNDFFALTNSSAIWLFNGVTNTAPLVNAPPVPIDAGKNIALLANLSGHVKTNSASLLQAIRTSSHHII